MRLFIRLNNAGKYYNITLKIMVMLQNVRENCTENCTAVALFFKKLSSCLHILILTTYERPLSNDRTNTLQDAHHTRTFLWLRNMDAIKYWCFSIESIREKSPYVKYSNWTFLRLLNHHLLTSYIYSANYLVSPHRNLNNILSDV